MTPLERVATTLQHKEPDRVPVAPLVCGAARRVYGVTYAEWSLDGEIQAKSMIQAQDLIGFDGMLTLVDLSVEAADFGQEMVYPTEDTAHPNYDNPWVKNPDYYEKIERIDPAKTPRMKEMIKYCDILMTERGSTVPVMGFVYGPLGILSMMRGAENLFRDCMKNKEQVIKGMEVVTDVLVDYIRLMAKTGVHGIVLDTLFASNTIMSKKLWKATEAPFTTRLADAIRESGSMVMVHNCGNGVHFDTQMEAMSPVAISFAYTPDGCKDMADAKAQWGDKTTLIGYISPAQYMYLGTPEQVKEECKKQIQELGKGGGFILATGCEFPPNGSLMNAIAMVEAAELYGRYPLT
ncbi:MAG: uroporphyrinogen decarboxylase family protein [Desulfomonile tiedjei]|uniref:Uroporphyrinogen decarboxylase family protein n=1 Tax=Desulfomonile tiedjei TaxID=2358 RepID=A0A9D6V5V2_9BACT|nr:uroporphyrinogen decarboxylase family protein [Desulfomonile tiedjei]